MKQLLIILMFTAVACNKTAKTVDVKKTTITDSSAIIETKQPLANKPTAHTIVFTVQIAALKNNNTALKNITNVVLFKENTLTKYRLGNFKTYKAAERFKDSIKKSYKGAFIQALKNNTPIHITKALNQK